MKTIQLTQNKVALIDDEDFEKLNQYRWFAASRGGLWYAARNILNLNPPPKYKSIYMHRNIIDIPIGKQKVIL